MLIEEKRKNSFRGNETGGRQTGHLFVHKYSVNKRYKHLLSHDDSLLGLVQSL